MLKDVSVEQVFEVEAPAQPKRGRGRPPGPAKPTASKADPKKFLKIGFSWLYALPASVGYGEHWSLAEDEAGDIADAFDEFLKAYAPEVQLQIFKLIEKLFPAAIFLFTIWSITRPRIVQTRELNKAAREEKSKDDGRENRQAAA